MHDAVPKVGAIGWVDLMVADAVGIRDFYRAVVGVVAPHVDRLGAQEEFSVVRDPAGAVCALYQT